MGLIVGAYGGSSAIFGPLAANILIPRYGLNTTFQILGVTFFVMTMIGSSPIEKPAAQFSARKLVTYSCTNSRSFDLPIYAKAKWFELPRFYLYGWGTHSGAAAGMMVISQLVPFVVSRGISSASIATMALSVRALGNVLGHNLFFGLDVRYARPAERASTDDRYFGGHNAAIIRGR